jgi:hypothetical protein
MGKEKGVGGLGQLQPSFSRLGGSTTVKFNVLQNVKKLPNWFATK